MSYLLNVNDEAAWNYSDSSKDGYMPSITGTVVSVEEVQSTNYATKEKEFWPDGNPKLNIKLVIQGQSGRELPWVFSPKSIAADTVKAALKNYNANAQTMADLGGLMVRVSTQGDSSMYHANNPRPWQFEILGPGTAEFRGVKEFVAPQQSVQQQPQQQQQPEMQGGYFAAPTAQTPPSPVNRQINQQQQYQQNQYAAPTTPVVDTTPDFHAMIPDNMQHAHTQMQQQIQQQQQQPPQGMPAFGGETVTVYDEDIPF